MAAGRNNQYLDRTYTEVGIPSGGMDTDTVPRLLPPGKAPLLKNFLMDRPGVLPMRGPICEGTTVDFAASIGLMGAWAFDNKLLVTRATAHATNIRDPWTQLYRPASGNVRGLSSTVSVVDLVAGGKTDVAIGAVGAVPFGRSIRVGNYVYGLSSAGLGTIAGNSYTSTRLIRWDGTSVVGGFTVYNIPNAPSDGCQDIAFHYNRIFVFGGIAPGVAVKNAQMNHGLYWTDQLATDASATPLSAALTAWQDDVSGLVNQIIVGSDEPSNSPVAMAHVGPNLALLKRRSLYMLFGTAPANFAVKQVSNEVGCLDPRSVVEYNGGVYFMSERGFMFFDGARVQNVSAGLNSTLVANALRQAGPQGVDGGYCRAALLDRGYILVTTGVMDGATLTATADTDAWLLHAPTGAWLQLSSGAIPSIIAGGRTVANAYLLTDQKVVKANYLGAPQNAPAGTRGFDSIDSGATKFVIPSRWTTRALPLGTPPHKSKLQRIVADYYWGLANGGWQVTTNTRGETGVVNSVGTLGAPATIATTLPARGGIDNFNETDEAYLDIVASSSAPATFNDAELHRIVVESQQSQRAPAAL